MPTLQDGRDAVNRGNLQQARLIFEAILQENPRSEEAWLGLAEGVNKLADQSFVGLGIVVGILGELQSRSLDDVMVVCPGWVRNKHLRWNPFMEELKPHPQRAGT